MEWVNALVQGVLLGGMYALLAAGLSLIFGVMRIVNLAHGVLAICAAYLGYILVDNMGIDVWLSIPIVVVASAVVGYLLQIIIFNRSLDVGGLAPLLVAFGLGVVLTQVLQEMFTADTRGIDVGSVSTRSIRLGESLSIGYLPLVTFVVGVLAISAIQLFLARTPLGRAMRAASDDAETVALMGIKATQVYAMATALALAATGLAGMFVGMRTQFSPTFGDSMLIFAFEAVIIGGLGSLWGTLWGGIVLGVAQSLGSQWDPAYGILIGHIVFLAILVLRPSGLLSRTVPA